MSPWDALLQEKISDGELPTSPQTINRDLEARRRYVDQMRKQAIEEASQREGFDFQTANLRPLLAMTDSLMGTNTAQSYENPRAAVEARKARLQSLLDKEQQSIADDQLNFLKLMEASQNNEQRNDIRQEFLEAYKQKVSGDQSLGRQRLNDQAAKGEKMTVEAAKAAGFARRLQQTDEVLSNLANQGYTAPSRLDQLKSFLPKEAQGEQYRLYDQTVRNFINATLRRESGAAISPSEFKNAEEQYLPKAGDSPQVLAQKAANRAQVFENFKTEGGATFDRIPYVSPLNQRAPQKTIRVSNGKEVLEIPPGDLKSAIRDGYREVK
jgi:hypothetical protein